MLRCGPLVVLIPISVPRMSRARAAPAGGGRTGGVHVHSMGPMVSRRATTPRADAHSLDHEPHCSGPTAKLPRNRVANTRIHRPHRQRGHEVTRRLPARCQANHAIVSAAIAHMRLAPRCMTQSRAVAGHVNGARVPSAKPRGKRPLGVRAKRGRLWAADDLHAPVVRATLEVGDAVPAGVDCCQPMTQRAGIAAGLDLDLLGRFESA